MSRGGGQEAFHDVTAGRPRMSGRDELHHNQGWVTRCGRGLGWVSAGVRVCAAVGWFCAVATQA